MLTDREKDIMICLEKGMEIVEIAKLFEISTHTVKAHIAAIGRKVKSKMNFQEVLKK